MRWPKAWTSPSSARKAPAIRRLMEEALQQRRRAQIAQRFLSGEWGVELETDEADQERERQRDQEIAPRPCCSTPLKQFIAPFLLDPEAHLAEPVRFELLRSARPKERRQLGHVRHPAHPPNSGRSLAAGDRPWPCLPPDRPADRPQSSQP